MDSATRRQRRIGELSRHLRVVCGLSDRGVKGRDLEDLADLEDDPAWGWMLAGLPSDRSKDSLVPRLKEQVRELRLALEASLRGSERHALRAPSSAGGADLGAPGPASASATMAATDRGSNGHRDGGEVALAGPAVAVVRSEIARLQDEVAHMHELVERREHEAAVLRERAQRERERARRAEEGP